jgi:hypothetical protein
MSKSMRLSMLAATALLLVGVNGSVQAQQLQQSPDTTFFVTSVGLGKGADLGGLDGADKQCQTLATMIGAGGKTWRAYLSSTANAPGGVVNARDRIGKGPWQNVKGVVVAQNVDDLHSSSNKLGTANSLTERGNVIAGVGYSPNYHDLLTGTMPDGRAFPSNLNMTCSNWTSSNFGTAMLGHVDKTGLTDTEQARSWNSTHQSRDCTQDGLRSTGGNGLFYCFAQ